MVETKVWGTSEASELINGEGRLVGGRSGGKERRGGRERVEGQGKRILRRKKA